MIRTTDGLNLFAEAVGTGPDTIVVPNRIYLMEDFRQLAESRRMVFYDPRNRGLSDAVSDREQLARGIHHDVDDLEPIRLHYGSDRLTILAHSYISIAAVLYATAHPRRVNRLVLIGAPPPDPAVSYPPDLRSSDGSLEAFHARFSALQERAPELSPGEFCRKAWALLRTLYVAKPESAAKLRWEPCDVPNEVNFLQPFMQYIMPSLAALRPTREMFSEVTAPVLIVHGKLDRSGAYGGARDWARLLPNARLLTIENAAHVPWIEEPGVVMDSIRSFLNGNWPDCAEHVLSES